MEQSRRTAFKRVVEGRTGEGAARKVYRGIMRALEQRQLVPGQRLVETELAAQFGVGRNAVREAMQRLAVRGIVNLSRFSSASIRQLDLDETLEVMDVADAMVVLVARTAALRYDRRMHRVPLAAAIAALEAADEGREPGSFSRARRGFYRTLLMIGGNRELMRLLPAVSLHIVHAKYHIMQLQRLRLVDYKKIAAAIAKKNPSTAGAAFLKHNANVRHAILEQARLR